MQVTRDPLLVRLMAMQVAVALVVLWSSVVAVVGSPVREAPGSSVIATAHRMADAAGMVCAERPHLADVVMVARGDEVLQLGFEDALSTLAAGSATAVLFCRS